MSRKDEMQQSGSETSYVHHEEGYSNLSLFQKNIIRMVLPDITETTASIKQNRTSKRFDSICCADYGAADGVNSIPIIRACLSILKQNTNKLVWILNDLPSDKSDSLIENLREAFDQQNLMSDCPVTLKFVGINFYNQVVPNESVDLGISISSIHWLSERPSERCNLDPWQSDEITKCIAANDWKTFLHLRSRELRSGGRLVISTFTCDGKKNQEISQKESRLIMSGQLVIKQMFESGIITQEEYEYARVFPFTTRTEDELLEPFRENSFFSSLQLLKINSYHMPDPFYLKWNEQGGLDNLEATQELVGNMVVALKTFYNSFWAILSSTRTQAKHESILDVFYRTLRDLLAADPLCYKAEETIIVLQIAKL